jgi:hypothetical protein
MRHLTEGTLRRMHDDPHSVEEGARQHFDGCPACQERLRLAAEDAGYAQMLLQGPDLDVNARAAYTRFGLTQRESRRQLPRISWVPRLGWRKPAAAAGIALAMTAVIALTPLADSLHKLLQPQQVQPVPVSPEDVNSLQSLASYGDVHWQTKPQVSPAPSAAAAARESGLPELRPGSLPSGIASQPTAYETVSQGTVSFTFSEAKARAAARQAGQAQPSFPAGVDNSTLVVQSGPGQAVIHGDLAKARQIHDSQNPQQALQGAGPVLVVGEIKAPTVYSSGISLPQLKQVLLSQPGLTPQARSAIEALDNPVATLLIPVPADQASAHPVTVQGVSGTALGDSTGLGAAVIWIKQGVVYFVGGTVSQDQALAVANSLT